MSNETRRKTIGILISLLIIAATFNPQAKSFFSLPTEKRVVVGDLISLNLKFPKSLLRQFSVYVEPGSKSVNIYDGQPVASSPGQARIQLRLFGFLPVKKVNVEVLPQTKITPGGQSVGIMLHSEGVIVVGQSIVEDKQGNKFNPAKEAGIEVGDVILKVNGQVVDGDDQVAKIINTAGKNGRAVNILIKRKSKSFSTSIKPRMCRETGRYRVGLYVRDSAAGVGTLSFYNQETGNYGALGHVITDVDTNQPIDVSEGRIVRSSIQGIQAGRKGQPGEKIGMFINDQSFSGTIEKNTKFGIYGALKKPLKNPVFAEPIPIALADQVKAGPAEMLTVLDSEKIERFEVSIKKIMPQSMPDSKGLIIEVTDPRLLKRTGGIIQGMSGSPIIQEGKIIGAVTHVFINDPTRGYGCLIEWMLMEADSIKEIKQKAS